MPIDVSALKTELLADPTSLGYASSIATKDLNRLADILNTTGTNSVTVGTVTAVALQRCVVASEYLVLTAAQRNLWDIVILTGLNGITLSNALVRGQIGAVWSAATVTRSNLSALQTRLASRIEVVFGEGERADTNIIDLALRP